MDGPVALGTDGVERGPDAPIEHPGPAERSKAVNLFVAAGRQPGPVDQGLRQDLAELAGFDQSGVRVRMGVGLRARAVEDQ